MSSKSYRNELELWEAKAAALRADDEKQPCRKPETSQQMSSIDETLAERGSRYGNFMSHAVVTQSIKEMMHASPRWSELADDQKEALEMVAHKVGRILNGDPNYHDSWHDIVGYAKLVADRLVGKA